MSKSFLGQNPPLNKLELKSLRNVFACYDKGSGKIDPHEMVETMTYFKFDEKDPVIFELLASLDNPGNKNGLTFDDMEEQLNKQLQDRESQKTSERVFQIFLENSDKDVLTEDVIKRVCEEVGDAMTVEEIRDMFKRATKNGKEMNFDEFYTLMTKAGTL